MKFFYCFSILMLLNSCSERKSTKSMVDEAGFAHKINVPGFQEIIDSANVTGSVLVYDLKGDQYYSNDFDWAKNGKLPASTFKIVNSIIALETNVVENDSTLFKWNGERRRLPVWEQDLVFRDAFHYSCVPCYQQIARDIGYVKMQDYLKKLDYGNMIIDSSNIDIFWLEGDSKINQFEQVDFLKRFYQSKLPIKPSTLEIMKKMMVIEENEKYKLSGKTGWSIRNGNNNGWFVGFIEIKNNAYFFATNIEPGTAFNESLFPMLRKDITYKALKSLNLMD